MESGVSVCERGGNMSDNETPYTMPGGSDTHDGLCNTSSLCGGDVSLPEARTGEPWAVEVKVMIGSGKAGYG